MMRDWINDKPYDTVDTYNVLPKELQIECI
jgi:hypothetical protein